MKKIVLSFALLLATYCAFAQIKTTDEEYAYMTGGYQDQVSKGMDMKKGYGVDPTVTLNEGNFTFFIVPLRRQADNNTIIGYIIKEHSKSAGKDSWLAIPVGNTDIMNKFFAQIKKMDASESQALLQAVLELKFLH
jgi:hypothetical protein